MAYGTTLNSSPVLTDDNQPWPEDQPPPSSSYANVGPQPQQSPYYLVNLAKSLWSGATLPGDVATGKASMTDPATQRRVQDLTGTVMGGSAAAPAEEDALNAGFRLYHGTTKKFDQPSNEFINTGQGAQSYGWGHYGAQAEPVALDMRDQLNGPAIQIGDQKFQPAGFSPEERALDWLKSAQDQGFADPYGFARSNIIQKGESFGMPKSDISSSLDALRRWQEQGATVTHGGHMQEWEVNADPEHFLSWDYPMSDQSSHVMEKIQAAFPHIADHLENRNPYRNPTGRDAYRYIAEDEGPQGASEQLVQAGIPGIRYFDQASRLKAAKNMGIATPDATSNFVLPDPSLIKVVRHYNAAGVPATFGNVFNDKPGQTP